MSSYRDRKKPRSIVRFAGYYFEGKKKFDCMVVDVSVTGARIHIEESSKLPQKFILNIQVLPEIPPIAIKSRRVWRNRDLAGAHFETMSRRDYAVLDSLVKIHRGEFKAPEKQEKRSPKAA